MTSYAYMTSYSDLYSAMHRQYAGPIDDSTVHASYADAYEYIANDGSAWVGQTVAVIDPAYSEAYLYLAAAPDALLEIGAGIISEEEIHSMIWSY